MGLTEAQELKLSTLPPFVQENLLERLEACSDDDQRAAIHGIIQVKFQEYSPRQRPSEYEHHQEREECEEIFHEDDGD